MATNVLPASKRKRLARNVSNDDEIKEAFSKNAEEFDSLLSSVLDRLTKDKGCDPFLHGEEKFKRAYPASEMVEKFPNLFPEHLLLEDKSKASRFNNGKAQLSYPLSTGVALDGVARVMEFGAKKYDRDNWKKGLSPRSILDSMGRHIRSYLDGEYIDPESGLPHVDHIACNALFLGYHTDREGQDGMA